jgi:hypothetical protein
MRAIKKVGVVISGPEGGIEWYEIGQKINGLQIASIKNMGSEFEDSIHSEYVFRGADGNPVTHIENCPVIVEWMEVSE